MNGQDFVGIHLVVENKSAHPVTVVGFGFKSAKIGQDHRHFAGSYAGSATKHQKAPDSVTEARSSEEATFRQYELMGNGSR
jgi:hypothetical protein